MDYKFIVTMHYDGNYKSSFTYTNALDAVDNWNKIVDWGFADEYATYNLLEPNGKMHTKTFYRNGKVTGK
jgi:hypothetical protein